MKKASDRVSSLIMKHLKGVLLEKERVELDEWLTKSEFNQALFDELTDGKKVKNKLRKFRSIKKDDLWNKTTRMISQEGNDRKNVVIKRIIPWYRIAAIASVLILTSITSYLFLRMNQDELLPQIEENQIVLDLAPGGDRALLTLADGTVISLDSIKGEISLKDGIMISKTADGGIVYEIASAGPSRLTKDDEALKHNLVSTPRGGQYQIVLSDGTKVWLNSASSLRYPIQFDGKSRIVELTGEAYFEVNTQKGATNQPIPFFVKTSKQTIEVLGTHFNVSAYEDEESVKTTLLEGKVSVSVNSNDIEMPGTKGKSVYMKNRIVLKQNEQAVLSNTIFKVSKVNTEEFIAWKNGYFSFQKADLKTVMHQLSRWYDVDIIYTGEIPKETFTGKIYRNMSISKVLDILAFAEVNFKIERTGKSTLTIY